MSTATFESTTATSQDSHPWWRRALVSFGIGLAVFTPFMVWLRRRRNHANP
jgi:hypothetical protein